MDRGNETWCSELNSAADKWRDESEEPNAAMAATVEEEGEREKLSDISHLYWEIILRYGFSKI